LTLTGSPEAAADANADAKADADDGTAGQPVIFSVVRY